MFAEARDGLLPSQPVLVICNDYTADPSRVPSGKGLIKILVKCVPYEIRGDAAGEISARAWDSAKEQYADRVIDLLTKDYIPNLKTSIMKRVVHSPVDQERMRLPIKNVGCVEEAAVARNRSISSGRCWPSESSRLTHAAYGHFCFLH